MDVFISWSGERSGLIARELRKWLPQIIQAVRPFSSVDDIEKGRRWSAEVAAALQRAHFGILVVLRDNQNAPWLLFEAGALSNHLDASHVVPLLIDLCDTDLDGPLIQFQCTSFSEEDFLRLVKSINGSMSQPLSDVQLETAFSKWWPDLRDSIITVSNSAPPNQAKRLDRDLLEETLRVVRRLEIRSTDYRTPIEPLETGVTFDPNSEMFLIDQVGQPRYEIELQRVNSAGQLLDWVLQLHGKPWIRDSQIRAFLASVNDICARYKAGSAQYVFGPSGAAKTVDWTQRVTTEVDSN